MIIQSDFPYVASNSHGTSDSKSSTLRVDGWGSIFFPEKNRQMLEKMMKRRGTQFCRFEMMEVCKLLHGNTWFLFWV